VLRRGLSAFFSRKAALGVVDHDLAEAVETAFLMWHCDCDASTESARSKPPQQRF
jgi:hypothetical protein